MEKDRLIVFCRYPVPGRAKTRLIPTLGRVGAADLHRMLTERTVTTALSFARESTVDVEICFEGGDELKLRRWLGCRARLTAQAPGDLGEKMHNAFADAFDNSARRVVLIGTDIPQLKKCHLRAAFNSLDDKDLVLGPSTDGGYWLMGLRFPVNLFQDINWGSKDVLERTLVQAERNAMSVCKLDPLTDIDTVEDFRALMPGHFIGKPYLTVIIPALNEESNIEDAISTALDEESEIIVVDGGSNDKTVDIASRAGVRVATSSPGRALQQNIGAKLARGDLLLFLHADTKLPADYIDRVFDLLNDRNFAVGAFMFKTDLKSPAMRLAEFFTNLRARYFRLPYGDQALFMRKSVFKSVGGFPDVPIAEDLMLIRKLLKIGSVRISSVPAVTSGRRWKRHGLILTTLINQLIMIGCCLGVSPSFLRPLYGGSVEADNFNKFDKDEM
ncbi:TIGR04283 family arsenosugar biosynthesis glycosyltransferase [Thermodesulfobacteriota bacterium]